jgi:hypothetical protein
MAGSLFIVSRTKPGTYNYMKLVSESEHDVILDRRKGERRRIHQRATPERRHGERRHRDVMADLWKSGWALVHPLGASRNHPPSSPPTTCSAGPAPTTNRSQAIRSTAERLASATRILLRGIG